MSQLLHKVVQHVRRVLNARRFGVRFFRRGSFVLPEVIYLNGKRVPLAAPREHGAKIDALTCFVNDEYGLSVMQEAPQTILDIGANIGFFSTAARGYFPAARIHAYEPNPRILSFLHANSSTADFQVFEEAVGARDGSVFVVDAGDSNQASVSSLGSGTAVAQVSLRNAIARLGGKVDLAKIDCEGAEWDLFECREEWAAIKSVRMEYHLLQQWSPDDVFSNLHNLGFVTTRHSQSGQWGTIWAERASFSPGEEQ